MERDFEREFRELKQNEIPDLWNRIEAGLSEKKNVASAPENVIAIDKGYSAGSGRFGKQNSEKGTIKKQSAWRKWGTLIAACVCVVIIFPAFSLLIRNKSYSGSDTSSSAATEGIACDTTIMESTADTAMVTEATAEDAEAEEGVAEAATENAAAAEEPEGNMAAGADGMTGNASAADAGGYDAASSTNNAAAPDLSDNTASEAAAENTQIQKDDEVKEVESEEEKAVLNGLMDGQVLEAVVVEIQNVETTGEETACQAVVLQADADKILDGGTQIAIVCDGETSYDFPRGPREEKELEEQETYQVTLRFDAEERRFVVLTVERGNRGVPQ